MMLAALQPGYLPWLGFFEQAHRADLFLVCDELNYEKYSWRNRNRIKTSNGAGWLTVPVEKTGVNQKAIKDVRIDYGRDWGRKHWLSLRRFYGNAPFFGDHAGYLETVYKKRYELLAELDRELIIYLLSAVGIKTKVVFQSDLGLEEKFQRTAGRDATDRLVFFCREFGAEAFYEGAAGKNYIDETRVREAGIDLIYQDYVHPVYPQLHGEFIPYLSVVDLLFNCGNESLDILAGRRSALPADR